jgi:hypothetical protein
MKHLLSCLVTALCVTCPALAKDLLSINATFPTVATNVVIVPKTSTNQVTVTNNSVITTNLVVSNFFQTNFFVFTNKPVATFDMGIGNGKARITLAMTNMAVNTNYTLLVNGVPETTFAGNVRQKARLIFQNFSTNKARPLTFDPRNSVVTVTNGSTYLKLVLGGPSQTSNIRYQESTDLTLLAGSGQAEASYDQTKLKTFPGGATNVSLVTFRVTLKGVSAGNYGVLADGVAVGTIVVSKGNKGSLVLESPAGNNDLPLTFDPRGRLIEVQQQGVVYFRGILWAKGLGP